MTAVEKIVKELKLLPDERLERAAKIIHAISEEYFAERNKLIDEMAGCLSEDEAKIYEDALTESRRIDD